MVIKNKLRSLGCCRCFCCWSTAPQTPAVHSARTSVSYTGRNAMRVNRVSHQSLRLGPAVAADREGGLSTALIDISSRGKLPPCVAKSCTRPAETQRDGGGDKARQWHCLQPRPASCSLFFLPREALIPGVNEFLSFSGRTRNTDTHFEFHFSRVTWICV